MDWVNLREEAILPGESDEARKVVTAGWARGPRKDRQYVGVFSYSFYESQAGGFFGYIRFPERVEAHFLGTESQLKRLLKNAVGTEQILQDKRWTFYQ